MFLLLKKRWKFKNPEPKCTQVENKRKNKCRGVRQQFTLHLSLEIQMMKLILQCRTEAELTLVWDQLSSAQFLVGSRGLLQKYSRKLQGKSSLEIAAFKLESRYDSSLILRNYNLLKMEIEIKSTMLSFTNSIPIYDFKKKF